MSPAATMTIGDAGRAVLDAADRLFYERGIGGVGMSEIRDVSGVSLRRLYALHPSKRDLVAAWLTDRHERWMAWFSAAVEGHSATGVDPVLAIFDALSDWVASPGYRGCAFINAIAESAEIDDAHRQIVADHKRSLIDHLAAVAAGNHPSAVGWLPDALGVLVDGAIVQSAVLGSDQPIITARFAAERLLETADEPHRRRAVEVPGQDPRRRSTRRR